MQPMQTFEFPHLCISTEHFVPEFFNAFGFQFISYSIIDRMTSFFQFRKWTSKRPPARLSFKDHRVHWTDRNRLFSPSSASKELLTFFVPHGHLMSRKAVRLIRCSTPCRLNVVSYPRT
ncbi:hypothetical protein SCLCIDRAFT_574448 [Scleroderma citrinum Foug A]|uniref:Uncharacterized protein n=1 Tax=Scleroderma citrinum Foug A TaxID=1036808 RepID=A0A0C2ZH84_9AGAM|nr:hypothetical protein SCLCIDRAFT_574448 [Scleroderma citrinum Foug A]